MLFDSPEVVWGKVALCLTVELAHTLTHKHKSKGDILKQ